MNKFQTKKFEINIDMNATKSQNKNDFVFEHDFIKNIQNEMQKITNEKLKTKIKLQYLFDKINIRFCKTKINEI